MNSMNKKALLSAAAGRTLPDLVLKNAQIVNVFTEQLEQADVAITDGYIVGVGRYCGQREIDLSGKIIAPCFMDGHMHLESSLLTPLEYEKAVLPRGTAAVMADPHEIANVAGSKGIDFMMSITKNLDMRVYYTLSPCVPSSPLEEPGCRLDAAALRPYYPNTQILGLAEVMNSAGVVAADPDLLQKIHDAEAAGKNVDGHAPGLSGQELCAYVLAGVRTDHECSSAAEGLEKLRLGLWIMIREGTAAKNLEALLPLCQPPYHNRCLFVTDDRHPEELLREGHMDAIIRQAVSLGADPIRAIKMCTYNTAQCFGLKGCGAVAPGYRADLAVLGSLSQIDVQQVFLAGSLVAKNGEMVKSQASTSANDLRSLKEQYPTIWHSFHLSPIQPELFAVKELKNKMRLIGLKAHELLTEEIIAEVSPQQRERNGIDVSRDILKTAVLERHHHTGHIGLGFVRGYGLKRGAIATSVAHDSHNIIVIGCSHADMAAAAERVRLLEGGLAVADGGEVIAELALPIGGLMSELPLKQIDAQMTQLKKAATRLGVSPAIDPFMTLSFVSLPVIPQIRLNGRGLIDVQKNQIIDVTFD
ncbi:MAG: adenine deaminase [bacterium]|nr:adenine deaminase [bacterium]